MKRFKSYFLLGLMLASVFSSLLSTTPASAVTSSKATPTEQVMAFTLMRAMQYCFVKGANGAGNTYITPEELANGAWFSNELGDGTAWPTADGLGIDCDSNEVQKKFISFFEFADGEDLIENYLKVNFDAGENVYRENGRAVAARVPAAIVSKYGIVPPITPALEYLLLKSVFESPSGCGASKTTNTTIAGGSGGATVRIVDETGTIIDQPYEYKTGTNDGSEQGLWNTTDFGESKSSCQTIADRISNNASAFLNAFPYMADCETKYDGSDSLISACNDGAANSEDVNYCTTEFVTTTEQAACIYGQKHAWLTGDLAGSGGGNDEAVSSCQIDGIGWIICPVVRYLAKVTDASYGLIHSMMIVQPGVFDQNNANSTYSPWKSVRDLANICFILVFLAIVYSHITSAGMSNYTLKKMLPKLVVGAILVNLSFWISGALVELSNIVGSSVYNILKGAGDNLYPAEVLADTSTQAGVSKWDTLAVVAIGAGASALVFGLSSIAILLPLLLTAGLAVVTVLVVLTVRQALIVMMIIISPLAFVAYILPNTEGLFKKWWGLFKTLLLLYPIISVVFAGSALASVVLTAASNVPEGEAPGDLAAFTLSVMAAAVSIIPLFITPILMQFTTGALGKVTGMVNNRNKGMIDRSKKFAGEKHKEAFSNALANGRGNGRWGAGDSKNPVNWVARNRRNAAINRQKRQMAIGKNEEVLKNDAEKEFLESAKGKEISLKARITDIQADAARKELSATAKELQTEEWTKNPARVAELAAATGLTEQQVLAMAGRAREGSTISYQQQARERMAEHQNVEEQAKLIAEDVGGAATIAGGIHPHGESFARAQAKQTIISAQADAVKASKSPFSETSTDEMLDRLRRNDGTKEEQMAMAGIVMSRKEKKAHYKLMEIMASRNANAEASEESANLTGNTAALDAAKAESDVVGDVLQQMSVDSSMSLFGTGDQALDQLGRGVLGRTKDRSGQTQPQIVSFHKELESRLAKKASAEKIADGTISIDDLKSAHKMAAEGRLSAPAKAKLKAEIIKLRASPTLRTSETEEQTAIFDQFVSDVFVKPTASSPQSDQEEYRSRF